MKKNKSFRMFAIFLVLLGLVSLMSVSVSANEADEHLIAYYSFENDSDFGEDSSAAGYNLIPIGSGLTSGEGVNGGKALYLDGTSGLYAEVIGGIAGGPDFSDSLQSFTISFYAKENGEVNSNSRAISTGYNGTQDGFNFSLARFTDGFEDLIIFQPIIGDSFDHWGKMSAFNEIRGETIDDWHHYVAVYDADTRTCTSYIDGEWTAEDYYDAPPMSSDYYTFCIGGSYTVEWSAPMYCLVGAVDEIKIYDVALKDLSVVGIEPEEEDTTDTEELDTEESDTEEPDTTAADETPDTAGDDTQPDDEEKGCGGSLGGAAVIASTLTALLAPIFIKKRKNF